MKEHFSTISECISAMKDLQDVIDQLNKRNYKVMGKLTIENIQTLFKEWVGQWEVKGVEVIEEVYLLTMQNYADRRVAYVKIERNPIARTGYEIWYMKDYYIGSPEPKRIFVTKDELRTKEGMKDKLLELLTM